MHEAISREKQLKRWHRQWKINLIESENPQWVDLSVGIGFRHSLEWNVPLNFFRVHFPNRTAASKWMLKRVQHDGNTWTDSYRRAPNTFASAS